MSDKDDKKFIDVEGTSMLDEELRIGGQSKKRYSQRIKLGEGGQATVFKVHDTKLDAPRAMKIIHSHFSANKDFVQSYKNEVKFTSQLNHPNIVKVYEADTEDGNLYIVMDIIEGKSMNKFKTLPVPIACIAISKAADAIGYAHEAKIESPERTTKGIIHGDIKPENMIIREDNSEVMVTDFGLATSLSTDQSTSGSIPMATWAYAAPELFDNECKSVKSDIYALGVSLVRLITGKTGYEDHSIIAMSKLKTKPYCEVIDCSVIPDKLLRIIETATHKDGHRRYESAEEFKDDLDKFVKEHYLIDNTYSNILGAYIKYKVEPQARVIIKETEPVKRRKRMGRGQSSPSEVTAEKPSMDHDRFKRIIVPILIILLVIAAIFSVFRFTKGRLSLVVLNEAGVEAEVWIDGSRAGSLERGQTRRVFPVSEEGFFRVEVRSPTHDDYEEYLSFSREDKRQTIRYAPPVVDLPPGVVPDRKYVLRIENPQRKRENVFLNGKRIGNLDGKLAFLYDEIPAAGRYTVKVGSLAEDIYISEHTYTWVYDPQPEHVPPTPRPTTPREPERPEPVEPAITYTLKILNPRNINAEISFKNQKHSLPRGGKEFTFSEREEFVLNIKDKSNKHTDFSQAITFSRERSSVIIDYRPDVLEKYLLEVKNPDKVSATVHLEGEEFSFTGEVFQRSFRDRRAVNVRIRAQWHEEQEFLADFSKQDSFSFTYQPERERGNLVINDIPEGLVVYLNDSRTNYDRAGNKATISNLKMGEKFSVRLESPQYDAQREEIEMTSHPYNLSFRAGKLTGTLRLEGATSNLAANARLLFNNREYSILNDITDLAVGTYNDVVFLFSANEYRRRSNPRRVDIRPSSQGRTVMSLQDFGVRLITVVSNKPQTKVYYLNQFVAMAPVDIPIIDETIVMIRVESGSEQDSRRVNLNELPDNRVIFRLTTDPAINNLFDEADAFFDRGDLANAERLLDQILRMDQLHEEALIMRMEILTRQLEEAYTNRQERIFKSRLDKASDLLEETVNGIIDSFERFKVLKEIGKYKYHYADVFITNDLQKAHYLENEALQVLQRAFNQRSTGGVLGTQHFHYDEAECYLAMTYQRLWELTKNDEYRRQARVVWSRNPFRDYTGRTISAGMERNPFRAVKEEWVGRL